MNYTKFTNTVQPKLTLSNFELYFTQAMLLPCVTLVYFNKTFFAVLRTKI